MRTMDDTVWAVLSVVLAHNFSEIYDSSSAFLFSEARLQGEMAGPGASVDPHLYSAGVSAALLLDIW